MTGWRPDRFTIGLTMAVAWAGSLWLRVVFDVPFEFVPEAIGIATAIGIVVAKKPKDGDDK